VRIEHLTERDGFMSEFVNVTIATDPFLDPYESEDGVIRTVFAWGHPVLKITGPGQVHDTPTGGTQRLATWMWLGLNDAVEPRDLTRHREVVANFLVELGMLGQEYEDAMNNFTTYLGNYEVDPGTQATREAAAFDELLEHLGEHDLPAWVDAVVARVPYDEEQDG